MFLSKFASSPSIGCVVGSGIRTFWAPHTFIAHSDSQPALAPRGVRVFYFHEDISMGERNEWLRAHPSIRLAPSCRDYLWLDWLNKWVFIIDIINFCLHQHQVTQQNISLLQNSSGPIWKTLRQRAKFAAPVALSSKSLLCSMIHFQKRGKWKSCFLLRWRGLKGQIFGSFPLKNGSKRVFVKIFCLAWLVYTWSKISNLSFGL